jgi:hypothetical protein
VMVRRKRRGDPTEQFHLLREPISICFRDRVVAKRNTTRSHFDPQQAVNETASLLTHEVDTAENELK